MIKIDFSPEELQKIDRERYYNPHVKIRRIMHVLWLKSKNLSHGEICQLASISTTTLTSYLKRFNKFGLENLLDPVYHIPLSELEDYTQEIKDYFENRPVATMKEAAYKIEELTGIKRSSQRVRVFLSKLGLRYRKTGMIPSKADPQKQQEYKNEKLEPLLTEAKEKKRHVYFVDAAHFVLAPFLGFLWAFCKVFIKAPSGRQRFNVLGALNANTHELVSVENDSYINAASVCDLLVKLRSIHGTEKISLILDNARYQKCKIVFAKAKDLDINLEYLPSYSPNLNLIERLWKFVKKKCLNSFYYEKFDEFKTAIKGCLERTHTVYKNELDTLLTHKFQTFDDSKVMAL